MMKAASIVLLAGMVGCGFAQPGPAAEAATFKERVLHSFGNGSDGQYPSALIHVNGMLYGTTSAGGTGINCAPFYCGTVFAVNRKTGAETVAYSFCSQQNCVDGGAPYDSLIDIKGTLYGTTSVGGADGGGTVFSLAPATGAETVLYSFCSEIGVDCLDGSYPVAGLINMSGKLYGTTEGGGINDYGTAFALDRKTGTETVLYSFCSQQNCTDGAIPVDSLLYVNGELYGTTYQGGGSGCGGSGCGTVFAIDAGTGAEKVLYSFCSQQNCTDGATPFASLIDVNGALYGTTDAGGGTGCGGSGCGTVFSIDLASGAETVLYSFCTQQNCTDGATPYASLIPVKGKFYGTTSAGGTYGYGTVFVLRQER